MVFAEHDTYPAIADITADFVYARLQKGDENSRPAIRRSHLMAGLRAKIWAQGGEPKDLPRIARPPRKTAARRLRLFHPRGKDTRGGGTWR